MDTLFKDWLRFDGLELGSEVCYSLSAAVGVATGMCESIAIVLDFIARPTPSPVSVMQA